MNWKEFKELTEEIFETTELEECWGYQVQPGTKWNSGLSKSEIYSLEKQMGFKFPFEYCKMLSVVNGFDRKHIAIDPDQIYPNGYNRRCYKYPEDYRTVKWLFDEIDENIEYVNRALESEGFKSKNITGFIPLYSHRALVAFINKKISPVVSVYGDDIVVFGNSITEYWKNELQIDKMF